MALRKPAGVGVSRSLQTESVHVRGLAAWAEAMPNDHNACALDGEASEGARTHHSGGLQTALP